MIENKIDNNIYYTFKEFNHKNIDHLFSSRIGWEDENKLINSIFGEDKKVVSLKQVHGNHIELVDKNFIDKFDNNNLLEGDGLLTDQEDVILKTYHADCTPLYFIDSINKVVGVAHAGWKGTYSNIMSEMIKNMVEKYGSRVTDIEIFIGPAIKGCCYEVSRDLFFMFKEKYRSYEKGFILDNNKYYLDLQTINYHQARNEGVAEENISIALMCTSCNLDKFYSYRREKGTKGRLITAISLKK